jgi:hypothetical protein
MRQLFNHRQSVRARTEIKGVEFIHLYNLLMDKLEYFDSDRSDPDAFCQDVCAQIEKHMGIFPNLGEDYPKEPKKELPL